MLLFKMYFLTIMIADSDPGIYSRVGFGSVFFLTWIRVTSIQVCHPALIFSDKNNKYIDYFIERKKLVVNFLGPN